MQQSDAVLMVCEVFLQGEEYYFSEVPYFKEITANVITRVFEKYWLFVLTTWQTDTQFID